VTFRSVTALVAEQPGRFAADLHPEWTIGGRPNGGYLLAILGRAATSVGAHPHVLTASAHYLRPPAPGPIEVTAEVLRAGRSASQVRARLLQDGRSCVDATFTTSTLDPVGKPYWDGGLPAAADTRFEDGVRVPPITPTGMPAPIMAQVDLRLDADSVEFAAGRPSGRGELRGWLALCDGEAFDSLSLLYVVDAFPPATFDIEPSGWVPTLELTTYVRALPAPGPVQVRLKAQLVDAQRVDETCWVWDSTGRLVAQATQLAGVRLG
jgi:acyl-coenzyme A thioesterase PaaI-like protein